MPLTSFSIAVYAVDRNLVDDPEIVRKLAALFLGRNPSLDLAKWELMALMLYQAVANLLCLPLNRDEKFRHNKMMAKCKFIWVELQNFLPDTGLTCPVTSASCNLIKALKSSISSLVCRSRCNRFSVSLVK
jgi:hypothetical protein